MRLDLAIDKIQRYDGATLRELEREFGPITEREKARLGVSIRGGLGTVLQRAAPVVGTASSLTTVTTAYTAGDMLGSETTLTAMANATGGGGAITAINVQNSSINVTGALDIRLFSAASTPAADNAANSWSDANSRLQVVAYQIAAPVASALNSTIYAGELYKAYTTTSSANLFLNVICLGAPAVFTAATDLQYTFEILQWQ